MKLLNVLLAALIVSISAPAFAQTLLEGKQYERVQMPQPTEIKDKVEVIEFFSYSCPHCFNFEPLLKQWVKKLPADAYFRKVPAIFRPDWAPGARIFYTLEAMGLLELHEVVFQAIQKERVDLFNDTVLFDWMAKRGVDRQKFADMYKSFAVDGKVRKAMEMTQEYGFGGVPALVIGGKYMPGGSAVRTHEDLLRAADGLIEKNRAELKKK